MAFHSEGPAVANRWSGENYVQGLMQERRNSSALAMEFRLSGTKPPDLIPPFFHSCPPVCPSIHGFAVCGAAPYSGLLNFAIYFTCNLWFQRYSQVDILMRTDIETWPKCNFQLLGYTIFQSLFYQMIDIHEQRFQSVPPRSSYGAPLIRTMHIIHLRAALSVLDLSVLASVKTNKVIFIFLIYKL